MARDTYDVGTGIDIPGLEAVIELGNAPSLSQGAVQLLNELNGRIWGSAFAINDRSIKERARVQQIDGLYDDPEQQEQRTKLPDRHGERAGLMSYGGRTIGLTGLLEAGSINAVRDVDRRMKRLLAESEQTMILHPVSEVTRYWNVCPDPLGASSSGAWNTNSTSSGTPTRSAVTDGVLTANELAVASATASGSMLSYSSTPWISAASIPTWLGQDLWVHGRVKVQTASGTVSSVQLLVVPHDASGAALTPLLVVAAAQASPATGSWYTLSATVPASSLPATTQGVSVAARLNYAGAGSFTLRWTRTALVPIPVGKIAPLGYFDGTFPGFSWDGFAPSRSRGPNLAVNQVRDPFGSTAASWEASNTSGATLNQAPISTSSTSGILWPSGTALSAIYYKVTNPDTTSRTLSLRTAATNSSDRFVVASGRTYSVQAALNVVQKPATAQLGVTWLDQSGSTISTSTIATLATGVQVVGPLNAIAPTGAVQAYISVSSTTNASGAVLELFISRVAFCDATDHGQYVLGDEEYALYTPGMAGQGARALLRRPWMLRRVRKASYSAPERQGNLKPVRDFTCSLRASDPRIYVADERNMQLTLAGAANYHFDPVQTTTGPPTVTGNPPTGYTQDALTTFSTPTWGYGGVGGNVGSMILTSAPPGGATPANGVSRFYYSSITYQRPRVQIFAIPRYLGGYYTTVQAGVNPILPGVGVVLKRTSSTNYIRVQWNAGFFGGLAGSTQHELEVWVNTGSGEVLRASADVGTPINQFCYLLTWLDANNVVWAQVINKNTTSTGAVGTYPTLLSTSYQLTASEITALGTGVAGAAGLSWQNSTLESSVNVPSASGAIQSYTSRRDDIAPQGVTVPVVGDVDTPQVIKLSGDLVNPTLTVQTADGQQGALAFHDTFTTANPVTIDFDAGSITDTNGTNRFGGLVLGSQMRLLQPGVNQVNLIAEGWTTGVPHMICWWRDARK